jgi:NADH-quinone oxidoreductase subunit L
VLHWFWIIPLLPLLGALVTGIASVAGMKLSRRTVHVIACGTVLLAFVLSVASFLALRGDLHGLEAEGLTVDAESRRVEHTLASWIPSGEEGAFQVDWGFTLDPLSVVMILVVTGVGFLIHVYSMGYMHDDPDYARYFCYLNLFTGMMLTLVLGSSLLVLFVGWEGVGLCSYLLIGFWYTDVAKATAGMKAFLVNRIGDFGFLLGMLLLFANFGTLNIQQVLGGVEGSFLHETALLTAVGLCLFVGAAGKSAQLPLYVWLPDAMAGPTPVSALIHAATMVTAGVYMVARMSPLYAAAPAALMTVAVVGAATALFAATIGLAQTDIKKVLAYSTVSQLGYMFLGCGVGAFAAGIFHLMTHAFFKGLLFLGSGSVIHAMSGEQDMRKMGGLKDKIPVTYRTFLIGTIAIAGFFPLAGFFSKDEILWKTWEHGHPVLWLVGTCAALLTAIYMFRLLYLTFSGTCRAPKDVQDHIHESPRSMTVPLMILAGLSVVGGFVGLSPALSFGRHWNLFEGWLEPVFAPAARVQQALAHGGGHEVHHSLAQEWLFIGIALAVATAGWLIARHCYRVRPEAPAALAARFALLHRALRDKWYVDEIYQALFIRPLLGGSRTLDGFDRRVVDGAVNGSGIGVQGVGQIARLFQTGYVRNYALSFLMGVIFILWYLMVR